MTNEHQSHGESPTVADLRLPPSFVTEHLIRSLSYQGAMSVVDLARHLHVHPDIVAQVAEPLKAAGLLESESSRTNFEALNKIRLSSAGQARVAAARNRTWYAGPLPVSLEELEARIGQIGFTVERVALEHNLAPFFFDAHVLAEIGQAVSAASSVCMVGLACDEQQAFIAAVKGALSGVASVPYAVFAAGNVIRTLDPRVHVAPSEPGDDVRRERGSRTRWASVGRPAVTVSGGVLRTDIQPAYDEEARFYLAPAPFSAFGGVLGFCDAHQSDREVLRDLARLWLAPGRYGTGVLLLRSGERIEVPWRAATFVMSETEDVVAALNASVGYVIDARAIAGRPLQAFLTQRLPNGGAFPEVATSRLAGLLAGADLATRTAAAQAARYLRDLRTYTGDSFAVSDEALRAAVQHAANAVRQPRRSMDLAA